MKTIKKSSTCIAALRTKHGKIMIGADRRASWDFSQAQTMPRSKLSKKDGLMLAGTGDGALCTLFVDVMKIPEIKVKDPDLYMFQFFYHSVVRVLEQRGYVQEHKILKIPKDSYAEIVVACLGKLYQVVIHNPEHGWLTESPNGLVSIDEVALPYGTGCGGLIAWGALLENKDLFVYDERKDTYRKLTDRERMTRAITTACEVSPGCGLPIDIRVSD